MFISLKKPKDDKSNFILSGILAFGLYILFVLLCTLYLKSQDIKKFDAVSKVTVLELDIILEPSDKKDVSVVRNKTDDKDTNKSNEVIKKSTSTSVKKRSDLKSLFAKVDTKSEVISKDNVLNIQKSTVTSRFKSKFEKQQKSQNISVSKLLDSVKSKSSVMVPTDSKNSNDKYYSKIYELLASRWNPILILDGLSAKVLVIISSNGDFEYKFLQYSGNSIFDDSLKKFLEKETATLYPKHSRGSKQEIAVTFTAKKE